MLRRFWFALALGLLSLLLGCSSSTAPAASPSASSTPTTRLSLKLGFPTTPAPPLPISIAWLAKDIGYYDAQGLDAQIEELQGAPVVIAALQSGEIDVASINLQDVLQLTSSGKVDLKVINSAGDANFFLIASRQTINAPADLAGKRFGVSRTGSFDQILAQQVLGPDAASVTFLAAGAPNARATALVAGQIDATVLSVGAWQAIAKQQGVKVLVDVGKVNSIVPGVSEVDVVMPKTLQSKAEALRRYQVAQIRASRYFAGNEQAWVDAMVKRSGAAPAGLSSAWSQFGNGWAVNGGLNPARLQKAGDFLYDTTPDLKGLKRLGVNDWADPQFVTYALGQLGGDARMDDPGRPIQAGK